MPHDPARVAETREWLQKAALDFRGARIDLDAEPPLTEGIPCVARRRVPEDAQS
jgi:hypothetical protein